MIRQKVANLDVTKSNVLR